MQNIHRACASLHLFAYVIYSDAFYRHQEGDLMESDIMYSVANWRYCEFAAKLMMGSTELPDI
ncbi:hypothetical protein D3C76_1685260 [compost metagenome]